MAKGIQEIFYPGEIEDRAYRRAAQFGVSLPPKTITDLAKLAASCGIASDGLSRAAVPAAR